MKKFSLRLNIQILANTEEDAKRKSELLIRELPRVEDSTFETSSLYSVSRKVIIDKRN